MGRTALASLAHVGDGGDEPLLELGANPETIEIPGVTEGPIALAASRFGEDPEFLEQSDRLRGRGLGGPEELHRASDGHHWMAAEILEDPGRNRRGLPRNEHTVTVAADEREEFTRALYGLLGDC